MHYQAFGFRGTYSSQPLPVFTATGSAGSSGYQALGHGEMERDSRPRPALSLETGQGESSLNPRAMLVRTSSATACGLSPTPSFYKRGK